jgi:hypothetical protein
MATMMGFSGWEVTLEQKVIQNIEITLLGTMKMLNLPYQFRHQVSLSSEAKIPTAADDLQTAPHRINPMNQPGPVFYRFHQ